MAKKTAILRITCPDRKGIVSMIADFLFRHGGNILHTDQHQDEELGLFLMRVEWEREGFALGFDRFGEEFKALAERFNMCWSLAFSDTRQRVAILCSKVDHCLTDLLYRHQNGELSCEIPLIISNHSTNRHWADFYRIPYFEIPSEPGRGKAESEERILRLLQEHQIDLIVLARYMQILSPAFVRAYPQRIINIHHSFLPAFLGAKPYHRAYERGVKLIGATSHYVTEQLDDGPIIEQEVTRISHRDSVAELVQKGKDMERLVLSRAVSWHLDHRVLVYENRTVVFD